MRAIAALAIGLVLAAGLAGCNKTPAAATATANDAEMSLGNPEAKVTVVEYGSLGCPHCAEWNNDVFPGFKTAYLDTGKVHYVFREMLTGDAPVAAAGFLLARCAGKDQYFKVVDAVFREEAPLLESGQNADKRDRLLKVAESIGMTEAQFDACVTNDASISALNARNDAAEKANIEATPTFIVNGQTFQGEPKDVGKAVDQALAAAK